MPNTLYSTYESMNTVRMIILKVITKSKFNRGVGGWGGGEMGGELNIS